MSKYGTTQKCKACDKTVHFAEMVSTDGIPYHKECFKCSECNGRIALSNYSAVDGKLYCKPHFEQLFKETGSLTSKIVQTPWKQGELNRAPSKVSTMFSGTQDKCAICNKTVYPLEKVTMEGDFYHKSCFRCAHGGCFLTTSNYAALDGNLYCKPHFAQLFKEILISQTLLLSRKMPPWHKNLADVAAANESQLPEAEEINTTPDVDPAEQPADQKTTVDPTVEVLVPAEA